MHIWKKLFGRGSQELTSAQKDRIETNKPTPTESASSILTPSEKEKARRKKETSKTSSSDEIIQYFDKLDGGKGIASMIRSRSVNDVETICSSYPLETIRLENELDLENTNRFERIICLARTLVSYEYTRKNDPAAQLPATFPAKSLVKLLVARLDTVLMKAMDLDIALIHRGHLRDYAGDLSAEEFHHEALTCFELANPSIQGDEEFFIAYSYYKIAERAKSSKTIKAARDKLNEFLKQKKQSPTSQQVNTCEQMLQALAQWG